MVVAVGSEDVLAKGINPVARKACVRTKLKY
jgi:hypothetical protein